MLDYKLLLQHVTEVNLEDRNSIRFTVSIYDAELDEDLKSHCTISRHVEGWGIRTALDIDGLCYESGTLYLGNESNKTRLTELYDSLLKKQYALHDDRRAAKLGWIDTMQDMMSDASQNRSL